MPVSFLFLICFASFFCVSAHASTFKVPTRKVTCQAKPNKLAPRGKLSKRTSARRSPSAEALKQALFLAQFLGFHSRRKKKWRKQQRQSQTTARRHLFTRRAKSEKERTSSSKKKKSILGYFLSFVVCLTWLSLRQPFVFPVAFAVTAGLLSFHFFFSVIYGCPL